MKCGRRLVVCCAICYIMLGMIISARRRLRSYEAIVGLDSKVRLIDAAIMSWSQRVVVLHIAQSQQSAFRSAESSHSRAPLLVHTSSDDICDEEGSEHEQVVSALCTIGVSRDQHRSSTGSLVLFATRFNEICAGLQHMYRRVKVFR